MSYNGLYNGLYNGFYQGDPGFLHTTNPEQIRDRIITVIKELTPTSLSRDRFNPHRNETTDFIEHCETTPASAFRRYQVVESGTDNPPETSSGVEEEHTVDITITVAYPRNARTGPQQALDRHDVMREDERKIVKAVGHLGKANFTPPDYPAATWLADGAGVERVDNEGGACDYLIVRLRFLFVLDVS